MILLKYNFKIIKNLIKLFFKKTEKLFIDLYKGAILIIFKK